MSSFRVTARLIFISLFLMLAFGSPDLHAQIRPEDACRLEGRCAREDSSQEETQQQSQSGSRADVVHCPGGGRWTPGVDVGNGSRGFCMLPDDSSPLGNALACRNKGRGWEWDGQACVFAGNSGAADPSLLCDEGEEYDRRSGSCLSSGGDAYSENKKCDTLYGPQTGIMINGVCTIVGLDNSRAGGEEPGLVEGAECPMHKSGETGIVVNGECHTPGHGVDQRGINAEEKVRRERRPSDQGSAPDQTQAGPTDKEGEGEAGQTGEPGEGDEVVGGGDGNGYVDDTSAYAEAAIQQCQQAQASANSCCNNPLKCTLGIDLGDGGVMQTILLGGASAAIGGAGNVQKACKTMKALGFTSTALNAAGAAKCSNRKNTCLDICEPLQQEFSALSSTNPQNPSYRKAEQQLTLFVNRCQSYEEQVNAQAMQAVQSGYAAKMSELCEETATTAQATDWDKISDQPVFNGDCSDPANASNPVCQNPCNQPGAENNPFCREAVPGLGDGSGSQSSNGSGFSSDQSGFAADGSDFNVGEDTDGQSQASTLGEGINPQQARNGGVPSNGGGFGGGGGGGGGGMPDVPSTGGQARGPSTDILKGVGGGGGYSVSQGGGFSNGGGFRGYGTSGAISSSKRKKFDLSQYLPGAKKDPKRFVAGKRPSLHPQIGPAHESMFKRVSNRIRVMCKLGRLMDCD